MVAQALIGMPGVGKTHVAAAYARARLAEQWRLVAWIHAEGLGRILAGLAAIATTLDLHAGEGDAEQAGLAVRHRLEIDGDRCLLVFDNATDPEALQPFIPATGTARVIITSNQQSVANLGVGVAVDVFSADEAVVFLTERTGSTDTRGARMLAAELGYLPLALAQAAAVIAAQRVDYVTYLDRLRAMPAEDLLEAVQAGQYPRSAATAILLSLDGIRATDETGLCTAVMQLLAVLSPAGVRRTLLYEAARQGAVSGGSQVGAVSAEMVDRAVARLAGISLLTFSVDGFSVSTHRLVMRVIRDQLAAANCLDTVCTKAADVLAGLAGAAEETWYEDLPAVRELIEQITALHESSAARTSDGALTRQVLMLRARALRYSLELGDSTVQSILTAEQLLADQERVMGACHPDTLAVRNCLGAAYQDAARISEAIALHEQNLAARKRVLGNRHPDTLQTRYNLATAYQEAGRTRDAIVLHEENLADFTWVLGASHRHTIEMRDNLATAYLEAGRTAEAIALHEQNLPDCERVLGATHPDTLRTRGNLAEAYLEAGRTGEAITLHEQNLPDFERVLGDTHPDTLRARHNIAVAYLRAGRAGEAITLHEQNLPDFERVLGATHPDTLRTRDNLAKAYLEAGRAGEAITLHEQPKPEQESNRQPRDGY